MTTHEAYHAALVELAKAVHVFTRYVDDGSEFMSGRAFNKVNKAWQEHHDWLVKAIEIVKGFPVMEAIEQAKLDQHLTEKPF